MTIHRVFVLLKYDSLKGKKRGLKNGCPNSQHYNAVEEDSQGVYEQLDHREDCAPVTNRVHVKS